MFERKSHPSWFKSMILAASPSGFARPVGEVLGWDVWTMDGKAYLFRKGRQHVLVADWFEFCRGLRWLGFDKP
jgi:hypothetical protein